MNDTAHDPNGYQGDDAVIIDGHRVDPHLVDLFFNGDDGSRVTDKQWDEQRRRYRRYGDDPFAPPEDGGGV